MYFEIVVFYRACDKELKNLNFGPYPKIMNI